MGYSLWGRNKVGHDLATVFQHSLDPSSLISNEDIMLILYTFVCVSLCVCVCVCAHTQLLTHVWLFSTPRTVAHEAPLSMAFSKHEYWGCHFLLQGIFPIQGLNPHLLHLWIGRQILYHRASWKLIHTCHISNPFISLHPIPKISVNRKGGICKEVQAKTLLYQMYIKFPFPFTRITFTDKCQANISPWLKLKKCNIHLTFYK